MGFASKNARKKLSHLKQIVSEFNKMDVEIQRVGIQSGDVLFFKVGRAPSAEIISAFLEHLHTKGLRDCMAMVVGPNDQIETMSAERLDELATAAGYHKIDPVAELHRGRLQVLRLLEKIKSEDDDEYARMQDVVERVREAIAKAEEKAKPTEQPPAEVPIESSAEPEPVPVAVSE